MSEKKPQCFGWVNASRKKLDLFRIKKTGDCKTCKILDSCTREYNQREYDQWQYEDPETEDLDEEEPNEVDEDEE
jgi:hypothetical protein